MNLIDEYVGDLPDICLVTDDPYRVKMIAAHHLDQVEIFSELRGQVALVAKFNNVPMIVMSAGVGITSTMAYITELYSKNKIRRIVYLGDCIANDSSLPIGAIALISKAYRDKEYFGASDRLYKYAETALENMNVKPVSCIAATNDNYLIEKKYNATSGTQVQDFASAAIYELSRIDTQMETLSILNVYENISMNEKLIEAVRQSGCHSAVLLALNTVIFEA